jgi:hypothetical protein
MNSEIEVLLLVYQKRLSDMTSQAIAYEARIQILSQQIQNLQTQLQEKNLKRTTKKTDNEEF